MRMLGWTSGLTKEDWIRNEYVRVGVGVVSDVDKMRDNRFRWFGYITRREDSETVRTVMEMNVEERRGIPKNKK